jgi:hypothetical protein
VPPVTQAVPPGLGVGDALELRGVVLGVDLRGVDPEQPHRLPRAVRVLHLDGVAVDHLDDGGVVALRRPRLVGDDRAETPREGDDEQTRQEDAAHWGVLGPGATSASRHGFGAAACAPAAFPVEKEDPPNRFARWHRQDGVSELNPGKIGVNRASNR